MFCVLLVCCWCVVWRVLWCVFWCVWCHTHTHTHTHSHKLTQTHTNSHKLTHKLTQTHTNSHKLTNPRTELEDEWDDWLHYQEQQREWTEYKAEQALLDESIQYEQQVREYDDYVTEQQRRNEEWDLHHRALEEKFAAQEDVEEWGEQQQFVPMVDVIEEEPEVEVEQELPLEAQLDGCIDTLYGLPLGLTSTGYQHLKNLLAQGDATLEEGFMSYLECGDTDELNAMLCALATRWRELSPHQDLLDYVDSLFQTSHVTFAEWDFLQGSVYLEKPVLLGAYANACEEAEFGGDAHQINSELFDIVSRMLSKQVERIYDSYADEARNFINTLSAQYSLHLSDSTHAYLLDLVDAKDEVLFACFAEKSQTQNFHELVDTLLKLGNRWRAKTPFEGLLALLVDLHEKKVINSAELDLADLMVYEQAPVLCSAYSLLDPNDPESLNDLVETLLLVLDRVLDSKFTRYCARPATASKSWWKT